MKLDLNQAELRIIADEEGPPMLDVYGKDADIHSYIASQLKNMTYDEFIQIKEKDPNLFIEYRQIGKTLNFGLLYGLTQKGVIKLLENNKLFYSYKDSCSIGLGIKLIDISIYIKKNILIFMNTKKKEIFMKPLKKSTKSKNI